MLRLLLFLCLLANVVHADDIFGKSRMRFASPTVTPVTEPTIQKDETPAQKNEPSVAKTEKVVSEERVENSAERSVMDGKKTPVFDGEEKVRNFMKPDFVKRDVLNDPRYKRKGFVKKYYYSMRSIHEELNRKEAAALEEAKYKGDDYVEKLRHRLWVERPFVLTYLPDDKTLNEALDKDPRNVMYQILTKSEFYPNSEFMTEENRRNIMKEIQEIFQEQSGFSLAEFEKLGQEERNSSPSVLEGENMFKRSIYFE